MKLGNRKFVCFIHFIWINISLGITLDWYAPNIEVHLPFCFIKIGLAEKYGTVSKPFEYYTIGII